MKAPMERDKARRRPKGANGSYAIYGRIQRKSHRVGAEPWTALFSELLEACLNEGPQIVTKRGKRGRPTRRHSIQRAA